MLEAAEAWGNLPVEPIGAQVEPPEEGEVSDGRKGAFRRDYWTAGSAPPPSSAYGGCT